MAMPTRIRHGGEDQARPHKSGKRHESRMHQPRQQRPQKDQAARHTTDLPFQGPDTAHAALYGMPSGDPRLQAALQDTDIRVAEVL